MSRQPSPVCTRNRAWLWAAGLSLLLCPPAPAQGDRQELPAGLDHELRRIYADDVYRSERFGPARWLEGGRYYTTVEPSASGEGRDLVRYETATGARQVVVPASALKPSAASEPLDIADYQWSNDRSKLLIFTNTRKVWRRNTRGDYWVLELVSGRLRQVGVQAEPATLMFAKFSPDGTRVGYVAANDLYVESLATGSTMRLTDDGSATIINGTSDWVYEEELGVRDGFRFSPDSTRIAYWRFDSSGVGTFTLIDNTQGPYPRLTEIPYPKVGTTNSAVRIGVTALDGGDTTWMQIPGDRRDNYVARMDWVDDGTLALQHLNRLQNRNDLLLADANSGGVRRLARDQSDSWVEVMDRLEWLNEDELLWLSERDGWRHAYAASGSSWRLLTDFEGDVIRQVALTGDRDGGASEPRWLYFLASPENATQSYLYRVDPRRPGPPERVTPELPGTHGYQISPDGRWAIHTYSRLSSPPVVDLVSLPQHRSVRVLADNAALIERVAERGAPEPRFFQIEIEPGLALDGWMITPENLEPGRKYPLLVYVYGEPAGQTVVDRWGGRRLLFHQALADAGMVVVSFDNRGTPAPRGAAWRKVVYGTIGDLSSRDQAAAVERLLTMHDFLDPERVAVWGWSGGGSNTLNAMFRFPELYRVGVSIAPVPDQTLYDTIYQERYMGLPSQNEDGYRLGSPISFADGLKGHLLLIHGSGDDNVHHQGTEKLVNRMIELGKQFDYMVYPNRSHSISEGEGTSLHLHRLIARYLLEHTATGSDG